jgi:transcription elongation factor Elf1
VRVNNLTPKKTRERFIKFPFTCPYCDSPVEWSKKSRVLICGCGSTFKAIIENFEYEDGVETYFRLDDVSVRYKSRIGAHGRRQYRRVWLTEEEAKKRNDLSTPMEEIKARKKKR